MEKINWKKTAIFSLVAAAISLALTFLIKKFAIPVLNISLSSVDINVREQVNSGINSDFGAKVLSYIQGYLPVSGSEWIMVGLALLVSVFAVIMVGRFVYQYLPWKPKSKYSRVALIMLIGTVALSAVLAWQLPSVSVNYFALLIGLYIYYFIVGWLTMLLDEKLKFVAFDI